MGSVYNRKTMKWATPLLVVACLASALAKKQRAFSLFSVVSFPNDECTTTTDATMKGICRTAEECGDSGGTESGNCASGFGVCCYHTIVAAGEITNNLTYIQNTGYPTTTGSTADTASKSAAFTVKGGANICQVRLDFDDVELLQPVAGVCTATTHDQLTIASTSQALTGVTNLCGTLTGSHLYLNNDGADPAATVTVTLGSTLGARKWKIKTTQIECDNLAKAPDGCLQYYTGVSGSFTSFNGGSTTNAMLANQDYTACIRKEAGMCKFGVRQSRGHNKTPNAFSLSATSIATAVAGGATCSTTNLSWITIPGAATIPTFCGGILSTVTGNTDPSVVISDKTPFSIGVVALAAPTANAKGFDISYQQIPCDQ